MGLGRDRGPKTGEEKTRPRREPQSRNFHSLHSNIQCSSVYVLNNVPKFKFQQNSLAFQNHGTGCCILTCPACFYLLCNTLRNWSLLGQLCREYSTEEDVENTPLKIKFWSPDLLTLGGRFFYKGVFCPQFPLQMLHSNYVSMWVMWQRCRAKQGEREREREKERVLRDKPAIERQG